MLIIFFPEALAMKELTIGNKHIAALSGQASVYA